MHFAYGQKSMWVFAAEEKHREMSGDDEDAGMAG